jgi:hypothetical protein
MRDAFEIVGGILSMSIFGTTVYLLLSARLTVTSLWLVYFIYTISVVLLLHIVIFGSEADLAKKGRHLSKRFPKYLEYAYISVISVSLLQIFVFAPRMADYVTWLQGDEAYLANQIKRIAGSYLNDECINRGTKKHVKTGLEQYTDFYFTDEYCLKLKKIVEAPDVQNYILNVVTPDEDFVHHVISIQPGAFSNYRCPDIETGQPTDPICNRSPIEDLVSRFEIVREFVSAKGISDSAGSNRLAWIGMFLLPIGIALRLAKTSVELFVPLQ